MSSRPITNKINGPKQDEILAYFDKCLNACNRILAPLTKQYEVGEITEELLQHISTHMDAELCAIHNGPSDPEWESLSPANKRLHATLKPNDHYVGGKKQ